MLFFCKIEKKDMCLFYKQKINTEEWLSAGWLLQ
jgi:hypothetical protein